MTAEPKRSRGSNLAGWLAMVLLFAFSCGCESRKEDDYDPGAAFDDETDRALPENRQAEKVVVDKPDHVETPRRTVEAIPAAEVKSPVDSNSDDTIPPPIPIEPVGDSRRVRDARALLARLADEQGQSQRQAAVALSGVMREVEDQMAMAEWITPLVEAKLKSNDATVREYSGRALMRVLQVIDDPWTLQAPTEALVDELSSDSAPLKQRQYSAVALSVTVAKIKDQAFLVDVVGPLVTATTCDPDAGVREYAGRALMRALEKTDDQWELQSAAEALVNTLDSELSLLKQRQYAAVTVASIAGKISDEAFLARKIESLVMAATCDPDTGVRQYAGRAFQRVLEKVDDEAALAPALGPLADALGHKETKTRRYAAWALATVVPRIKDAATLEELIGPLSQAASNSQHKHIGQYCGRALKSIRTRLKPKPPAKTAPKK
ncbi:MAG: hypothetical protein QGH94_00915 [Phycisphaerae bacterium]|jgi:PIN domain nuclease of toxin-antitoxin system|nr:hypothetical protein [Phycisphaerae bacterium]MDP7286529.1 hypothetical protein [Phycisphaerae bacterium]